MKTKILIVFSFIFLIFPPVVSQHRSGEKDRKYWIEQLCKIADPVLINLSQNTLRQKMPVETKNNVVREQREKVTHLEAFGRLLSGIAPWLELGADDTKEGKLRAHYIKLTLESLKNCVDPNSPDKLNFSGDKQALVDAAFLAEGLLRAKTQLWMKLDKNTQQRLISALKETRSIVPFESNWLLFSAMIEAALWEFTGENAPERIEYAVNKMKMWYKGDAWYGDGEKLHFDYYGSFVIHPMLLDILRTTNLKNSTDTTFYQTQINRSVRYAVQLERLISPEGTYPAIGRSLAYRFGAFQTLSQVALLNFLPEYINPAQVRCALTAVIRNQISAKNTYDKKGWLQLGFCGHQIEIAEDYISTGSLYLCATVFLPLGLPASDPFWSAPFSEWTNLKAWKGRSIGLDKALKD